MVKPLITKPKIAKQQTIPFEDKLKKISKSPAFLQNPQYEIDWTGKRLIKNSKPLSIATVNKFFRETNKEINGDGVSSTSNTPKVSLSKKTKPTIIKDVKKYPIDNEKILVVSDKYLQFEDDTGLLLIADITTSTILGSCKTRIENTASTLPLEIEPVPVEILEKHKVLGWKVALSACKFTCASLDPNLMFDDTDDTNSDDGADD